MEIRINTERVREVGQRLGAEADRLTEIGHELQGAIHHLDTWAWDGRSRARAESLLARVRPESGRVADGLGDLGRKLARVAATFEQEDNTAARDIENMSLWELVGSVGFVRSLDVGFLWRLIPFLGLGTGGVLVVALLAAMYEPFRNWLLGSGWVRYHGFDGELFRGAGGQEIQLDDINQGALGDCYLMAAMGAIANTDPERIRNMVVDNGDGTYTVTFYVVDEVDGVFVPTGDTKQITVDASFPADNGGCYAYGHSNDDGELWPAVVEKAYVEWKGGAGDYEDIEGGFSDLAMAELTGVSSRRVLTQDVTSDTLRKEIQEALANGHPVAAGGGTQTDPTRPFYASHAYAVESIYQDAEGIWRVDLYNSHGEAGTHPDPPLTIDEFRTMLGRIYISNA